MDDKEKEKQKRIKEVAKHLHPHDDEPDPTAYMGNYNFPPDAFCFLPWICHHVCSMAVRRDRTILKDVLLPAYFNEPTTKSP